MEEQKEHQEEEEEVEENVWAALQTQWTSAETRQSPRDEDQEEEELNLTREEKQAEESKQSDEVGFLLNTTTITYFPLMSVFITWLSFSHPSQNIVEKCKPSNT